MEAGPAHGGLRLQAAHGGRLQVERGAQHRRVQARGKVRRDVDLGVKFHHVLFSRYSMAMIARNTLVAAAQNIQGAQRYLSNVEFPYCSPSEVCLQYSCNEP